MMKHLSILFTMVISWVPLEGWTTIPDSLKCRIDSLTALTHNPDVGARYSGEFGIAWELYDIDNPVAAHYAGKAYKSICEIGDSARMLRTGRLFGQLLRRVDKLDSALLILEHALPIAVALKDSIEQAKIHNAIAISYTFQGRYDMTLLNNLKALEIWRSLNDTLGIIVALDNTGVNYYKMGNWVEAERYYQAALDLQQFPTSFPVLTNLALVKIYLGDTLAFHALNERVLREMTPQVAASARVAYAFNTGLYFLLSKRYKLAIDHFHSALLGAELNDDFRKATESRFKIAECYARIGLHGEARKMIDGLEEQLVVNKMNDLRLDYYDLLSNALEKQGQFEKALVYKRKYIALKDTVDGQMAMNKVLMARVKYDEERSYQALSQQAEVISLKEQVITRQQLLIFVSTILLILLLVFGFVLIRFYRFQKQISKDLDSKVLERTRELELSESELTSHLGQQQALMEMISSRVQSSIATIRGLCAIKHFEAGDRLDLELEKVATNLMQVPQIIRRSLIDKAEFNALKIEQLRRVAGVNGDGLQRL
jgi:tetratricopeptide (TPR) repeat protein